MAVEAPGGTAVGRTPDKQIKEIEETQEALRESIAEAKHLADKAQQLLQKHKKAIERQSD
jgi:prefoldin subunit 5